MFVDVVIAAHEDITEDPLIESVNTCEAEGTNRSVARKTDIDQVVFRKNLEPVATIEHLEGGKTIERVWAFEKIIPSSVSLDRGGLSDNIEDSVFDVVNLARWTNDTTRSGISDSIGS